LNRLVGIDPSTEEADARVDGGVGGAALGLSPGRGPHQHSTAHERATAVTTAGGSRGSLYADVSVVDRGRSPYVGTGSVSENCHCSLLESGRESTRCRCTAPAGDDAALTGVVASVRRSHRDVVGVSVGVDGGKPDGCYIVGITLVTVVRVTAVPDERGERPEGACAAGSDGAVSCSSQH